MLDSSYANYVKSRSLFPRLLIGAKIRCYALISSTFDQFSSLILRHTAKLAQVPPVLSHICFVNAFEVIVLRIRMLYA